MINLFRRRPKTIRENLLYVEKNPKVNFQLDIVRYNLVEIQIVRQRMLLHLELKEIHPNGIAFNLAFNENRTEDLNRFLGSNLHKNSIELKNFDNAFVIMCENKINEIIHLLSVIQNEIYGYTEDTVYGYSFLRHRY